MAFATKLLSQMLVDDLKMWCSTYEIRGHSTLNKAELIALIIEQMTEEVVLSKMTVEFLKQTCRKNGVKGFSKLNKDGLLELLRKEELIPGKKLKKNPKGPNGRTKKASGSSSSEESGSSSDEAPVIVTPFDELENLEPINEPGMINPVQLVNLAVRVKAASDADNEEACAFAHFLLGDFVQKLASLKKNELERRNHAPKCTKAFLEQMKEVLQALIE